jgi:hypothetical protein
VLIGEGHIWRIKNGIGNVLGGEYVCDVKDKFKISTLVFTHRSEFTV